MLKLYKTLKVFGFYLFYHIYLCLCVGACNGTALVWRSEDYQDELVLSFHEMDPGHGTQASHLTTAVLFFETDCHVPMSWLLSSPPKCLGTQTESASALKSQRLEDGCKDPS